MFVNDWFVKHWNQEFAFCRKLLHENEKLFWIEYILNTIWCVYVYSMWWRDDLWTYVRKRVALYLTWILYTVLMQERRLTRCWIFILKKKKKHYLRYPVGKNAFFWMCRKNVGMVYIVRIFNGIFDVISPSIKDALSTHDGFEVFLRSFYSGYL